MWRDNVAAGSINDGYWFELPKNPGGPSFTTTMCPSSESVYEFKNNTAHSNGVHGLRIYPVYLPLSDPCDVNSTSSPQYFYNFTSYRNGGNGIFGKLNGDLHHVNTKLLDNRNGEIQWVRFEKVNFTWDANFVNLLAVGSIDPSQSTWEKRALWAPQNEFFYVSGATFVNYKGNGAISGCLGNLLHMIS